MDILMNPPVWAEWAVMDGSGRWSWFEDQPVVSAYGDYWVGGNGGNGRFRYCLIDEIDWRKSQRPVNATPRAEAGAAEGEGVTDVPTPPGPRSGVMHWSDRLLLSGVLFGAAMQAARLGDTWTVYAAATGGILSLILIGCDCLSAYARSEATAKGKT